MPRQKLNWSLERSRIQADRDTRPSLKLTWTQSSDSGLVKYIGHDADGRNKGGVYLLGSDFVSFAWNCEDVEAVRVGEFPAKSGCMALRQAQAAVEAYHANLAAPSHQVAA